jgi:hypothetical protein
MFIFINAIFVGHPILLEVETLFFVVYASWPLVPPFDVPHAPLARAAALGGPPQHTETPPKCIFFVAHPVTVDET